MRKDWPFGWTLILWIGAFVLLCALLPGAAVTMPPESNLTVSATALGLTLITAANRDRQ
jgi:hypothetical protein